MRRKAAIVDYGVGNLRSLARAVGECGAEPVLASTVAEVNRGDVVILPGVGAFGNCVDALRRRGLLEVTRRAIASGRAVLGICVGMQMLLEESNEFGTHAGLGVIPGNVRHIPSVGANGRRHKIPHVGWRSLQPVNNRWNGTLLSGLQPGEACYFVHSFAAYPRQSEHQLATCDLNGLSICAAVRRDNVVGVQFHPEKSGPVGLRILSNFVHGLT